MDLRESKDQAAARAELRTWGVEYEPSAVCHSFTRRAGRREKRLRTSLLVIVIEAHEHAGKGRYPRSPHATMS